MRKITKQRKRPQNNPDTKVYSYYRSSRQEPNNVDTKQHRQKLFFTRWSLNSASRWFVVLVVSVLVISVISVDSSSPIIRLDQSEKPLREVSVYREGIGQILQQNLANRTKLTFDYTSSDKKIEEIYPEVKNVEISLDLFGRKPVVRLGLYQPAFQVISKGVSWVVDERGVALAKSEDQRINQSVRALPVINDMLNIGGEAGEPLLTPDEALFLTSIFNYLRADDLTISTVNLPAVPQEVDIKLNGDNYYTKLNSAEEAAGQYGTWMAARSSLLSKGTAPAEYIDIRAGEKVFWK